MINAGFPDSAVACGGLGFGSRNPMKSLCWQEVTTTSSGGKTVSAHWFFLLCQQGVERGGAVSRHNGIVLLSRGAVHRSFVI